MTQFLSISLSWVFSSVLYTRAFAWKLNCTSYNAISDLTYIRRGRRGQRLVKKCFYFALEYRIHFKLVYMLRMRSIPNENTKAYARVKRRTSHEPNPIQPISLMRGSAFAPIKFHWFYLERLRRSSRWFSHESNQTHNQW